MADDATQAPKKGGIGRLLLPAVLLLVSAGAGFAVTFLGVSPAALIPSSSKSEPTTAFVELEPMTVSVVSAEKSKHLRVRAALEVDPLHHDEVLAMQPRITDVMITYLNSVEMADIENPSALLALRTQMRRRIDLVLGGDRVRDLLVQEFVIN